MTSVLIADDQELMRMGFRMVIESQPDLTVSGEVADGRQAVAAVARDSPDVVLMDVRMPELDGVAATREIVAAGAETRVIILTTFDLDEYVYAALRAGASGFLLKDAQPAELLSAIRAVADGDAVVAPSVTRRLLDTYARRLPAATTNATAATTPTAAAGATTASGDAAAGAAADTAGSGPAERLKTLTAREVEVLMLVARSLSNAEIAQRLVVTEATVKTHVGRILAKLELRDRVQIVVFAYESGLVTPSGEHP